jgi:hypothetical protein
MQKYMKTVKDEGIHRELTLNGRGVEEEKGGMDGCS